MSSCSEVRYIDALHSHPSPRLPRTPSSIVPARICCRKGSPDSTEGSAQLPLMLARLRARGMVGLPLSSSVGCVTYSPVRLSNQTGVGSKAQPNSITEGARAPRLQLANMFSHGVAWTVKPSEGLKFS